MPITKNSLTRYQILDQLLSDRYHDYTLDDLVSEVNSRLAQMGLEEHTIGRRSIEKDIHYLEFVSPWLVEIKRYSVPCYDVVTQKNKMKRCLSYADPSFSIFHKALSADEEYLLRETLLLLGQFDGLPELEGLDRLRMGLKQAQPNRQIVSFTKNPLEHSTCFAELFTAIANKQVVEIEYHKFEQPAGHYILYPHLLREFNRRWYLFATVHDAGERTGLRCFGLERINKITPCPAMKYQEYEGDLLEHFEDIVGVTRYDNEVEHVLFWVSDHSKNYAFTRPFHESQKHYKGDSEIALRVQYPQLQGGAFFSVDCISNYELTAELMAFGSDLVILSPAYLRDKMLEEVSRMKEQYEKIINTI